MNKMKLPGENRHFQPQKPYEPLEALQWQETVLFKKSQ